MAQRVTLMPVARVRAARIRDETEDVAHPSITIGHSPPTAGSSQDRDPQVARHHLIADSGANVTGGIGINYPLYTVFNMLFQADMRYVIFVGLPLAPSSSLGARSEPDPSHRRFIGS